MTYYPRTVLHGTDQSGPTFSTRPGNANFGHSYYQEDTFGQIIRDSKEAEWVPVAGVIPFYYSFGVHGGAISTIDLATIPDNFVIYHGNYDVSTALVGAGASVAFGCNTTTDLATAIAIGTSGTAGQHALIPDWATIGDAVKATAARTLQFTISGGALTAGVIRGCLWGNLSD